MTDRPDNPPMSELTARDFLAAAALEGCVEKQFSDALLARLGSTEAASAAIAGAAYQIADACLLARQGGVDPLFAAIEERDRLLEVARHARETAITVLAECKCENPPKWAETLLRMANAVLPPDPEES